MCSFHSDYHSNFINELKELLDKYPEISVEIQDEKYSDTRKKAFQIRNKFGATINPFVGIKIDGEFKKGFYSEIGECNINNIKEYLNEIC